METNAAGTGASGDGATGGTEGNSTTTVDSGSINNNPNGDASREQDTGTSSESTAGAQLAKLNFTEVHAKLEAGEDVELSDEQLSEYEKWYAEGMKPQDDNSQSQTEAPDTASPADGAASVEMKALMAEVGAKTPQEVPAKIRELRNSFTQASGKAKEAEAARAELESAKAFFKDLANEKPEALEHFKKMTGKDYAKTQPATQTAQVAGQDASQFLLSDEQIEAAFFSKEEGKAFNDKLKAMQSHYEKKLQDLMGSMKQYESYMKAEQDKAASARVQSQILDEILAVCEKYPEDYGLQGKPIRTLIEGYLKDPANPPAELSEFMETLKTFHEHKLPSLDAAHKFRYFDKNYAKIAEAKINAAKSASSSAKPTVGVHGATSQKGSSTAEISDADAEAMINGTKDIPDEWYDQMGELDPKKAHPKVYKAWNG